MLSCQGLSVWNLPWCRVDIDLRAFPSQAHPKENGVKVSANPSCWGDHGTPTSIYCRNSINHRFSVKQKESLDTWLHVCIHNIYIFVHIRYIHCTYREGINTCTFSQSHKPINLYTHKAAEGTPGLNTQKCLLVGGTGEEAQDSVYKRLIPLGHDEGLALQIYIKVKTFSKSRTTYGEWKWDSEGCECMLCFLRPFQALKGTILQNKGEHQKMPPFMTWTQKSCNVTFSPIAHKATFTGKWATRFQALIWSGPGTWIPIQRLLVRQRAGLGARLLCLVFPQRIRIKSTRYNESPSSSWLPAVATPKKLESQYAVWLQPCAPARLLQPHRSGSHW